MKIDIDFDEIKNGSIDAAIKASGELNKTNPHARIHFEQIELITKISTLVTTEIIKKYHHQLENSLDRLLSNHQ